MNDIDFEIRELKQQLKEAKAKKEKQSIENPKTIADRIRKFLYSSNMTQVDLSVKSKITIRRLSSCFAGTGKFTAEEVEAISNSTGLSCDYLIKGENKDSNKEYNDATVATLKILISRLKERNEDLEEQNAEWRVRAFELGYIAEEVEDL